MTKIIIPSFILMLTLAACTNDSEHQELLKLRKENTALKTKLISYDNAVVITRENINKYVGALAYGPESVKTNETVYTDCYLYLHDLPLKVECKMDQENQSVKATGKIGRSIQNSFPGAGKRTLSGKYTVTFPDGGEWSIPWEKQVNVNQ